MACPLSGFAARGLLVSLAAVLLLAFLPTTQAATLRGTVTDVATGDAIPGANVTLFRSGEAPPFATRITATNGTYEFLGLPAGGYRVQVFAEEYLREERTVSLADNDTRTQGFALRSRDCCAAAPEGAPPLIFWLLLPSSAVLLGALFARLHRSALLQNVIRQRVFEHVRANPGRHYRAILQDLGLAMGALTYHLNTLERGGYITSRQDGIYRRFYVAGMKAEVRFLLSDTQQRIVLALQANEGISQSRLADSLGISRALVNYHVHVLRDAGMVRVESRGRETACYLVQSGKPMSPA